MAQVYRRHRHEVDTWQRNTKTNLFTCNYVVSVRRGFLFLFVLGMGCFLLLWHSLGLPYNYFERNNSSHPTIRFTAVVSKNKSLFRHNVTSRLVLNGNCLEESLKASRRIQTQHTAKRGTQVNPQKIRK